MQSGDLGRGLTAGEELGELDDGGDEEDEIVLDASNVRQSNRPQGILPPTNKFFHSLHTNISFDRYPLLSKLPLRDIY